MKKENRSYLKKLEEQPEIKEAFLRASAALNALMLKYEETQEMAEQRYERAIRNLRSFAEKEGLIMPYDFDEFYDWYLELLEDVEGKEIPEVIESLKGIDREQLCLFHKAQTEKLNEIITSTEQESKAKQLKESLRNYGFFELKKVMCLTPEGANKLIEGLSRNMAYGIAMLDFLGFCEHLDKEQGTKYKANIILSKLYNPKVKEGTTARHYRTSLIKNKARYTSYLHKNEVQNDYQELKEINKD